MKNLTNQSGFSFHVKDEDFRKSSWSKNNPKTCVMVAVKEEGVALQDSKDLSKKTLFFTHDEWKAFLKGAIAGEF
jgi:hypothetical protein